MEEGGKNCVSKCADGKDYTCRRTPSHELSNWVASVTDCSVHTKMKSKPSTCMISPLTLPEYLLREYYMIATHGFTNNCAYEWEREYPC